MKGGRVRKEEGGKKEKEGTFSSKEDIGRTKITMNDRRSERLQVIDTISDIKGDLEAHIPGEIFLLQRDQLVIIGFGMHEIE